MVSVTFVWWEVWFYSNVNNFQALYVYYISLAVKHLMANGALIECNVVFVCIFTWDIQNLNEPFRMLDKKNIASVWDMINN